MKKLEEFAQGILDPIWIKLQNWVKELSWGKRIAVLMVVLSVGFVIRYYESLPLWVEYSLIFSRVVININETTIPLSTSLSKQLHETTKRLSNSLQQDITNPQKMNPESPWALSQAVIASNRIAHIDKNKIQTYFENVSSKKCNCWQEILNDSYPSLIPASGWIIYAMAELGIPATDAEISFFLNEQHKDGWWGLFPLEGSEFASTYGTAWAVLGLQNQLSNNLVSKVLTDSVVDAISKASAWLISNRENNDSRWKNYPLSTKGQISESISGLVLHTLNLTSSDSISQIKESWLDKIPLTVPLVSDSENYFIWIPTKDKSFQIDKFVQIKLPWLLLATIDSYSDGDFFQRIKALKWLEDTLKQKNVINADRQPDNWWRAELLLAINYALQKSTSKVQSVTR